MLMLDPVRGGDSHDLASPSVARHVITLASDPRCMGVVATVPCKTWSVARMRGDKGGPTPLRNVWNPLGFFNAFGALPYKVAQANACADHAVAAAMAVAQHGGSFIFENPVSRGMGSEDAFRGRESHSPLWGHPSVQNLASLYGSLHTFDQCMVGAPTEKRTTLLVSRNLSAFASQVFDKLTCNHGGHPVLTGTGKDGAFRTSAAERFPPRLNLMIAQALVAGATAPWPPADDASSTAAQSIASVAASSEWAFPLSTLGDWLARRPLGRHRDSSAFISMDMLDTVDEGGGILNCPTELLLASGDFDTSSPWTIFETCVDGQLFQRPLTSGESTWRSALLLNRSTRNPLTDPTYHEAMRSDERKEWEDEMASEIGQLTNHGTIKATVPEDSLPTWDPVKRKAYEVIDYLWVLHKKYNELGEWVRNKARAVIDGAMQKRKATVLHDELATFAPTPRNVTCKVVLCKAALKGAMVGSLDIVAAYLSAPPADPSKPVYARPPLGYREKLIDERGVALVWELGTACYGEADAGRAFDKAKVKQLASVQKFKQSDFDPCYLWKEFSNGERIDFCSYVDDALYAVSGPGGARAPANLDPSDLAAVARFAPNCAAELERFAARFEVKFLGKPRHFLGMKIDVESPTRIAVSAEPYVRKMAEESLPLPLADYPIYATPATDELGI
jgi:hypothetical protein